ncbi:MAG TPA: RNA methyltransferase [Haliscomenobacter sp.]|uniref:TrmH family RNA methyltransferase n=1 Tax=Haliscomenobacter sp. TaxID=2717303 RepID=UPI002BBA7E10|nr:RNA methyltransferase [Haliscomenobacter sp.]HOY16074.1 RNA methyltransferase [Haliscomenobacter sp.]HPH21699.1 RNA methyltransferase [Haliscomenobacter sp.]
MQSSREQKIRQLAQNRQFDLTVILENVDDPHNIGAVLRSCDSVGIREVFVLYTRPGLQNHKLELGKRSSAGSRKWIDVYLYREVDACMEHVRRNYQRIYATHLAHDAKSLYELDLSQSAALMFGNEADGLSELALSQADGNFIIPQVGMAQSLNVSVACAVSLYEAFRQRNVKGLYGVGNPASTDQQAALLEDYFRRQEDVEEAWKTTK